MNDLQKDIEELRAKLEDLEAKTKECNELALEYIDGKTFLVLDTYILTKMDVEATKYLNYGRYRKSKDEAERALKAQTRQMRLGALVEYCGGSKEFVKGEENWYIRYDYDNEIFHTDFFIVLYDPEKIYATKEVMQKVVDILNSDKYSLDV